MFPKLQPPTTAVDMFAAGIILYIVLTGTHPFDPYGDATNEQLAERISKTKDYKKWEDFVFDDRVKGLSPSCISLMKALLEPNPERRMTSLELQNHSWIRGHDASTKILEASDVKLKRFWQKRFRAAIREKYGNELSEKLLHEIFLSIDVNGDGTISLAELELALKDILGEDNVKDVLISIDADGNGSVDYQEFVAVMKNDSLTKRNDARR
jgi:serine/threonine protein kinase